MAIADLQKRGLVAKEAPPPRPATNVNVHMAAPAAAAG